MSDRRPDDFCKLLADRRRPDILGAHVLGEYSAETVQTVAACMAAGLTEGVSMAAQKVCRAIGIERIPQVWSYLGDEE